MCIKINDLIFRLNTSCMRKKYSVTSITSRKFSIASLSDINTDHLRVPGSDWSQDSSSETSASLSSSQSEPAWSWVVLLGSFICLCVLDGISYTFGMLLGKLLYCSFRNLWWLYKASKKKIWGLGKHLEIAVHVFQMCTICSKVDKLGPDPSLLNQCQQLRSYLDPSSASGSPE